MLTSGGEESRVLRGDVRREDEGVPSQPLCVYLKNGQHDRHDKAAKGSSRTKRGHKKKKKKAPPYPSQSHSRIAAPGGLVVFCPRAKRPSLVHSSCGRAAKKSYFKLVSDWVTPRVAR